jgi:hypothetical protein
MCCGALLVRFRCAPELATERFVGIVFRVGCSRRDAVRFGKIVCVDLGLSGRRVCWGIRAVAATLKSLKILDWSDVWE